MDIDQQDGTIRLSNGVVIHPDLTQDAFRASPIFEEVTRGGPAAAPWIHYRLPGGKIDGRDVYVSLCFYDQMLVSVDLSADLYPPGPKSWDAYSDRTEAATKDFHDRLLQHLFLKHEKGETFHVSQLSEDEAILNRPMNWPFPWGSVYSSHDPRGGGTLITMSYGNRFAEAVQAGTRDSAESAAVRSEIV